MNIVRIGNVILIKQKPPSQLNVGKFGEGQGRTPFAVLKIRQVVDDAVIRQDRQRSTSL